MRKRIRAVTVGGLVFLFLMLVTFIVVMLMTPSSYPSIVESALAPSYGVTVEPTTPSSEAYTPAGTNWTISFRAKWSYGDKSGQPVENATAVVQVTNQKNEKVAELKLNTTSGLFSFNYSASSPSILNFNVTRLIMQDNSEWNTNLKDAALNLYGLRWASATVLYDSFQVSLISSETDAAGATRTVLKVTYALVPDEGLSFPEWATYSHQTFLPKIASEAKVAVNGVEAQKTDIPGIFIANITTWTPTCYLHVAVSQENWMTKQIGFSFVHNANAQVWTYAVVALFALSVVAVSVQVLHRRKSSKTVLKGSSALLAGGFLLTVVSILCLYWGLVAVDGILHGFDWLPLAMLEFASFSVGLLGAFMALKRANQAFVIASVIAPLIANSVVLKAAVEAYEMNVPWLDIAFALAATIAAGVIMCNLNDVFSRQIFEVQSK